MNGYKKTKSMVKHNVVPAIAGAGLLLGGPGAASAAFIWVGDAPTNAMSEVDNWDNVEDPPAPGTRNTYEFNLAAGGTVDVDDNYAASSITFGTDAGAFTFEGQSFRNATSAASTTPMSVVQQSSAQHTFNVDFLGMHDGVNFSGEGTGNLIFTGNHSMFNRTSQINVNTTSYRPIWEGSIGAAQAGRARNFGGSGTFEIAGAGTLSAASNVTINTLLITNEDGNALGSAAVNVRNGSTIAGTGSVSSGTTTLFAGATVSPGIHGPTTEPGNEVGTLTFGNLTPNPGFLYDWDIAGSADLVLVNGRLVLAETEDPDQEGVMLGHLGTPGSGLSQVNVIDLGAVPQVGAVLFETGDGIFGPDGETQLTSGTLNWQVTGTDLHAAIEGNNIVLIPEPATLALMGIGGLLLMRRRSTRP